jgi:hypothetical protein
MLKPSHSRPNQQQSPKASFADDESGIVSLKEIVRALARQQAKQDHEAAKQYEKSSNLR